MNIDITGADLKEQTEEENRRKVAEGNCRRFYNQLKPNFSMTHGACTSIDGHQYSFTFDHDTP
jgi:hypothetical protein